VRCAEVHVVVCLCRFAFVEFADVAAANAVLKQHEWELDGRPVYVDRAGSGGGGGGRGGGGGGRGGGRGGGDAGGGQSKFQRTSHYCFVDMV